MNKNLIIGIFIGVLIMSFGYALYPHIVLKYFGSNEQMGHMMMGNSDDALRQHCQMMPQMQGCERYASNDIIQTQTSNDIFNLSNDETVAAKPTEIVELKDGDTYTIEITKVLKEVGNTTLPMLAYNGQIPGPILKIAQDSTVKITVVNKVKEIGETTLHSHGVRLKDDFDGVPRSMGGKQDPIMYGKSFTYEVTFKDAGIFWYHPHIREDLQQELGLYGNYLVTPTNPNYYNQVESEQTLILDDIALENNKIKPFYKDFSNYVLMGRYGNTMMINGETNYNLKLKYNTVNRLYFTNVSSTRVYNLKIPGMKIKLIGSDLGKYEKEQFVDSVVIAPAERYIIEVLPVDANGNIGTGEYEIQNVTPEKIYTLGKITITDIPNFEPNAKYTINAQILKPSFFALHDNSDVIRDIDTYRKYFDKTPDKFITLDIGHKGMGGGMMGMMGAMGHSEDIEWEDTMPGMNKQSNSENMEWKIIEDSTKKENMDINWAFKKGDVIKIRIKNEEKGMHPMQHPFHLHGQRFLVLDENGVKNNNLVWKDTVLVKTGEYVDILVDMSNPGEWMAHCHIAEHLSAGMMMHFSVKK